MILLKFLFVFLTVLELLLLVLALDFMLLNLFLKVPLMFLAHRFFLRVLFVLALRCLFFKLLLVIIVLLVVFIMLNLFNTLFLLVLFLLTFLFKFPGVAPRKGRLGPRVRPRPACQRRRLAYRLVDEKTHIMKIISVLALVVVKRRSHASALWATSQR